MDKIDKDILRELFRYNCRASYRSLARKFGLSPNTVKNRVTKMINQGVILKFQVSLNNEMTGLELVFGLVFTDGTENSREFVSQIGSSPMITYMLTLTSLEGGAYFIDAKCGGPNKLAELGTMLRGFDHVQHVELHMAFRPWKGRKIEFSKAQLKVIRCLRQDARMRIEEIAQKTGMASKTVRRILRELEPGNGLFYHCRVDYSAGGVVDATLRIEWDDKMTSLDKMFDWIRREYDDDLWIVYISSTEPVMFACFMLDSILDFGNISNRIREEQFVKSTTPLIAIAADAFEGQGDIILREMLDKAGV
ncbi:MAG: winged helix-turn-helix transcriptional regulator [Candidatus Thorarchaeota archaeon]